MHKTFLMSFSDKRDDRRTAVHRYNTTNIYPPLDKRYSPIISSICGPNKSNTDIKTNNLSMQRSKIKKNSMNRPYLIFLEQK